ncbi:hypothetical protein [Marinobacter sp.]|uniref:hypothetical protein n=1 Tax=Marinobacter sp. TaxID=50741 RepID=UPI0034A43E78
MLKQQSHIVAPISDELRTRALYTVGELRERGKADKEAIDKLYNLIVEMTDDGLDFFFLEPLRRLNASSMMMGMAKVGISSMLKGSKMVVHKVLKKLDDRSLGAILDFIEEIIHEPETAA